MLVGGLSRHLAHPRPRSVTSISAAHQWHARGESRCRIVHALAIGDCGLARSADIVTYLAEQSAGQCGPCINGLPRLAQLLTELAYGTATATGAATEIRRIADLVDGRGSCRHPDGTARFVRSALDVFASDILLHNDGQCEALLTTATGHDSRKESRV